jgi:nucleoside-diphosphate-sugar epimerase
LERADIGKLSSPYPSICAAAADPAELERARRLAAALAAAGVTHVVYNSSAGRGCGWGISQARTDRLPLTPGSSFAGAARCRMACCMLRPPYYLAPSCPPSNKHRHAVRLSLLFL